MEDPFLKNEGFLMQEEKQPQLKRSMTPGQMEMIAIGGTIGSGLFMGGNVNN